MNGLDHPLSARAVFSLEDAAKSFVQSRLNVTADAVAYRTGYANDVVQHAYIRQQIVSSRLSYSASRLNLVYRTEFQLQTPSPTSPLIRQTRLSHLGHRLSILVRYTALQTRSPLSHLTVSLLCSYGTFRYTFSLCHRGYLKGGERAERHLQPAPDHSGIRCEAGRLARFDPRRASPRR